MPYFRIHVSDGKIESVIEEKFESEARLREQIPKRGWTTIPGVEPISEPTPQSAAPAESLPPAIRADQIREHGNWVYLPAEIAAQHPLHGIGGWTGLLLAIMIISGLFGLWPAFQLAQLLRYGDLFVMLFVAVLALQVMNLVTIVLLIKQSRAFPTWFIILAGSSIAVTLFFFALGSVRAAEIGNVVSNIIWLTYVLISRRVNVTFRGRVEREDEWLQKGLAVAGAPALAPAR
jgi:hypothetical protein